MAHWGFARPVPRVQRPRARKKLVHARDQYVCTSQPNVGLQLTQSPIEALLLAGLNQRVASWYRPLPARFQTLSIGLLTGAADPKPPVASVKSGHSMFEINGRHCPVVSSPLNRKAGHHKGSMASQPRRPWQSSRVACYGFRAARYATSETMSSSPRF